MRALGASKTVKALKVRKKTKARKNMSARARHVNK